MIAEFQGKTPKLHPSTMLFPSADVIGDVELGEEVCVWPGAVVRGDLNYVKVGRCTNIQDNVVLHPTEEFPVVVGDYVTIGHGAIVHACVVRDRCLIGMGAVVLDGAEIGEESIIAAGAVVAPNSKIPPRSMVMGVPGKVVRGLSAEEASNMVRHAIYYMNLARKHFPAR
ncbi:MAG TPA: gamma carbonic anhydrase family protein [Firmicutes bacterium]|nr:gamma carbonic anhydrase family protein [Bacillota bacterium]